MAQHRGVPAVMVVGMAAWLIGCAAQPIRADEGLLVPPEQPADRPTRVAGQVIVKFHPEAAAAVEQARQAGTFPAVDAASLEALFARFGITTCSRVFPDRPNQPDDGSSLSRIYLLSLAEGASVEQAVLAFSQEPVVEYAEPNYIVTIQPSLP